MKKKSDLMYKMVDHIKKINASGKKVKHIRMDNAGENAFKFKEKCEIQARCYKIISETIGTTSARRCGYIQNETRCYNEQQIRLL